MPRKKKNGLATFLGRSFCLSVMYLLRSIGWGTLPSVFVFVFAFFINSIFNGSQPCWFGADGPTDGCKKTRISDLAFVVGTYATSLSFPKVCARAGTGCLCMRLHR